MKTKNLFVFGLVIAALAVFQACSPTTPDPEPEQSVNQFLDEDVVNHVHVVGKDPCPQNFASTELVNVSCTKRSSGATNCEADSAVIQSTTPGLVAQFSNGTMSTKLDENGTKITFKFTCAIAQSFNHTYEVVFFKNGKQVGIEDLEAIVEVRN